MIFKAIVPQFGWIFPSGPPCLMTPEDTLVIYSSPAHSLCTSSSQAWQWTIPHKEGFQREHHLSIIYNGAFNGKVIYKCRFTAGKSPVCTWTFYITGKSTRNHPNVVGNPPKTWRFLAGKTQKKRGWIFQVTQRPPPSTFPP